MHETINENSLDLSGSSAAEGPCFCAKRFPARKTLSIPNYELQHALYERKVLVLVTEDDQPTVEGFDPQILKKLTLLSVIYSHTGKPIDTKSLISLVLQGEG